MTALRNLPSCSVNGNPQPTGVFLNPHTSAFHPSQPPQVLPQATHQGELVRHTGLSTDKPQLLLINNTLFSWSASLEVQIWTGGKGALNQHIFKVISDNYPKSFYFYQLVNYLQHFKMMAENCKTTMGHITQEHLKQSRIAVPLSACFKSGKVAETVEY